MEENGAELLAGNNVGAANENAAATRDAGRTRKGDEHNDSKKPAAKKRRVIATNSDNRSLLLDSRPEIIRHVYSFLSLREALVVRQTCRRLNAATDAFRYSQLTHFVGFPGLLAEPTNMLGFATNGQAYSIYVFNQATTLGSLNHNDKLRAVLRNESLGGFQAKHLLGNLISCSKTDNGEAVAILLEDGRSDVDAEMLDEVLKKDFTSMAAALQDNEVVKAGIRMCDTCSVNIGCYICANSRDCVVITDDSVIEDSKHCRSCTTACNNRCAGCDYFICPLCCRQEHFNQCDICRRIYCEDSNEECFENVGECMGCDRMICDSCSLGGGDDDARCCASCDDGI